MADGEREIRIECPRCGATCRHRGDLDPDMAAFCGNCHVTITRELKQAFFKDVSAGISSRLVEKENAEFFSYLEANWRRERRRGNPGEPGAGETGETGESRPGERKD